MNAGAGWGIVDELRELWGVYRGRRPRSASEGGDASVAVVLGTQVLEGGKPSRTLDARTRHGARLYAEGRVRWVVPTGGWICFCSRRFLAAQADLGRY